MMASQFNEYITLSMCPRTSTLYLQTILILFIYHRLSTKTIIKEYVKLGKSSEAKTQNCRK